MPRTVVSVPDRPHPDLLAGLPVLRAMLEEQRQFRLDQLLELTAAQRSPAPTDSKEPRPEPAAELARAEVATALIAGARQALDDIEAALERMLTGRYGMCTRCTGSISLERLYVLPQTGVCADCQRASVPAGTG